MQRRTGPAGRAVRVAVLLALPSLSVACDELTAVSVRQVSPAGATSEAGDSVTLEVSLTEPPSRELEVFAVSSNEREGVASPALGFGVHDWRQKKQIRITGVDDAVRDGDTPYEVRVYARARLHPSAGAWRVASVQLMNRDDDDQSMRISGTPSASH